jgi:hypothetical protein
VLELRFYGKDHPLFHFPRNARIADVAAFWRWYNDVWSKRPNQKPLCMAGREPLDEWEFLNAVVNT